MHYIYKTSQSNIMTVEFKTDIDNTFPVSFLQLECRKASKKPAFLLGSRHP
jgi:hypothetical protein